MVYLSVSIVKAHRYLTHVIVTYLTFFYMLMKPDGGQDKTCMLLLTEYC
jgi:hypothetical protein